MHGLFFGLNPSSAAWVFSMRGQHLDISSDGSPSQNPDGEGSRRFVGIHFTCCSVYHRIYINAQGTAYKGNCPRCSRPIRIRVGPGGTDNRFFTAQ